MLNLLTLVTKRLREVFNFYPFLDFLTWRMLAASAIDDRKIPAYSAPIFKNQQQHILTTSPYTSPPVVSLIEHNTSLGLVVIAYVITKDLRPELIPVYLQENGTVWRSLCGGRYSVLPSRSLQRVETVERLILDVRSPFISCNSRGPLAGP